MLAHHAVVVIVDAVCLVTLSLLVRCVSEISEVLVCVINVRCHWQALC